VKTVIKVAIFLLIVLALYRFVPVYVHYQEFKDAVHETALFSKDKSEAALIDRVMELAAKYKVPLQREDVQVRREPARVQIDASYVEQIEWLPGYRRPQQFDVHAEAIDVR
jgi:hypothetical protein